MPETLIPSSVLELLALDFEPQQDCDVKVPCPNAAAWRVTCQWTGCWGFMCQHHAHDLMEQQARCTNRNGMKCTTCGKSGHGTFDFEPILSTDDRLLW